MSQAELDRVKCRRKVEKRREKDKKELERRLKPFKTNKWGRGLLTFLIATVINIEWLDNQLQVTFDNGTMCTLDAKSSAIATNMKQDKFVEYVLEKCQ